MQSYTPTDEISEVQLYDLTDLVLGDTDGESNQPVKQLANRTEWLINRLGGYRDIKDVTGSGTITVADANKLIVVTATTNVTLTADALSSFRVGSKIAIIANLTGGGPFWVNLVTVDNINDGSVIRTNIWLYDGEMIELVRGTSSWLWITKKGNFDVLGEVELKRFAPRHTLIGNGTSGYLRTTYPRLWEKVSASAVTDGNWLTSGNRYKQQFSTANGTTLFRLPDYRAMYFRALDIGRGISLGRLDAVDGGYEEDGLKDHFHNSGLKNNSQDYVDGSAAPNNVGTASPAGSTNIKTGGVLDVLGNATGKTETTVKSAGFTPYIYY